jgi:hypothetical protein
MPAGNALQHGMMIAIKSDPNAMLPVIKQCALCSATLCTYQFEGGSIALSLKG